MFPPPVKGPPLRRILKELAKLVLFAEIRGRLEELSHEPIGFVARAMGQRHRELKASGREWGEEEIQDFLDVHLPAALSAAEQHAQEPRP